MQEEDLSSSTIEEIEAVTDIPVEVEGFTVKSAPAVVESGEESDVWWMPKTRGLIVENGSEIEVWWSPKEAIGVYGSSMKNSKFTGTNKYKNAATTSFSGGSLFSSPKYAYYPYDSANSSNSQTEVQGMIPQTQIYNTSVNFVSYDYKIGKYKSRSLTGYNFSFSPIVTYVKFAVNTTGTDLEGEKLQSVKMTVKGAERQLWGSFSLNLTRTAKDALTWNSTEDECNSVTLNWANTPTVRTNSTVNGYMTTAPAVKKGDVLEFEVVTANYKATFTRTSEVDYSPNLLVSYPITLSGIDDVVIEDLNGGNTGGDEPTEPEEPQPSNLSITSFKFTVAKNPGKILGRELYLDGSTTKGRSVTEVVCEVDNENRKIKAFIPYLNNRQLIPTFEIPEGLSLGVEEIATSGETMIDFAKEKVIVVADLNAGTYVFYEVELTNTGLPVVVINQATGTTSNETDSEYTKASNAWYTATQAKWVPKTSDWKMEEGTDNFMVYNADGTSAITDKNGAIVSEPLFAGTRLRGNVTQQMPKKSFAVKLDKKSGVLDMPAHKRWVLLANWKDRTMMRNAVAFGLADVFSNTLDDGIAWNPSGQYVELVYNGVHVGTYYLCEQIKIDGNRLDINDPYDAEDAYSGNPEDYGYLLECDDGYDETWQFTTANYIPFLFKDDANDAMLSYATTFVRDIEDKLYAGNYTDAYEKMDLTSMVDFLLIQELMMNSELKHPKSCYTYINNGKFYAGPIWDFDWNTLPTSGNSEENYSYTASMLAKASPSHQKSGYPDEPKTNDKTYMWYPMLVKDATFKNLAAERWNAVKDALLTYVNTEIPQIQQKIAKSEAENSKMWKVTVATSSWGTNTYGMGGGKCGDESYDFSKAVSTLQSNLTTRINGMSYVSNKNWPSISYSSGSSWGW